MLLPDIDFKWGDKISFKDAVRYPYKERFVDIDGVKVCYIDEGSGLPVIMIHGLGGNLLHYKENIPYFKKNFRVIALDLPGYGKSDKPEMSDAVMSYVLLLKKFVSKLGIEEAVLIGNSMGGHISCIFAAKYKKIVKGLVLADSAGLNELNVVEDFYISNVFTETLLSVTPSFIMETTLKHNFYRPREEIDDVLFAQKAMVGSLDYDAFCHALEVCAKSMAKNTLNDITDEIKCPTLIVWGKNDRLIDVKYASMFREAIENSNLIIYESCGHISQLEKYEDFNRDVEKFILENKIEKTSGIKKFFKFLNK
jgi:pimeloyl-ACP methyl ester carboxylesterase